MCTAISLDGVVGRSFDYECSFGEQIIITPRERVVYGQAKNRYAMLGVGVVREGVSLYFDGVNEWGLWGAALNFPGYAVYHDPSENKAAISSGDLVGFLLGFCKDIHEISGALKNIVISWQGEQTPLHWMFADKRGSITVESVKEGLKIYENPFGVLTNSPPFPNQLTSLAPYLHLNPKNPNDNLTDGLILPHSRGMGGVGLPGDFSSQSRFIRAVFLKKNTLAERREMDDMTKLSDSEGQISRFFHIASSLSIPLGSVVTDENLPVSTRYISCADTEELTYYFSTYGSRQIRSVSLSDKLRDGKEIKVYPLYHPEKVERLN